MAKGGSGHMFGKGSAKKPRAARAARVPSRVRTTKKDTTMALAVRPRIDFSSRLAAIIAVCEDLGLPANQVPSPVRRTVHVLI